MASTSFSITAVPVTDAPSLLTVIECSPGDRSSVAGVVIGATAAARPLRFGTVTRTVAPDGSDVSRSWPVGPVGPVVAILVRANVASVQAPVGWPST